MINKYNTLLILNMSFSAWAQQMKSTNVSIPQYNEKGQLEYILRAHEMHVYKHEVEVYKMQINGTETQQMVIKSPYCKIDLSSKTMHSKECIMLNEKGLKIRAVGYLYDMQKKVLTLHSQVHIELDNNQSVEKEKNMEKQR